MDVDVEGVEPLFARHLGGRPVVADPSVVHQDVDWSQALGDLSEHPLDLVGFLRVQVHGERFAARTGDP